MNTLRHLVLPLTLAATLPVAGGRSQDTGDPVPDAPDPRIEATVEELEKVWPEPGGRFDERVVEVVRALRDFTGEPLHPRDRERLGRTFLQVLTRGEVRPPADGAVYRAALSGLARLGPESTEVLIELREDGRFPIQPDYQPLRAAVVQAIGRTDNERAARYVIEVVKASGHDPVLIAAGRVLRRYADADQALRKEITETLARRLAGFENLAWRMPANAARVRDPVAYDAYRTLTSLDGIWRETLHEITGVRQPNGQQWWDWYQEHEDEDWSRDDADDGDGASGGAAADRR